MLSKGNLRRLVINKSFLSIRARQTMEKANIDKHRMYEYSLKLNEKAKNGHDETENK